MAQEPNVCMIDLKESGRWRPIQPEGLLHAVATFGSTDNFDAVTKLHGARCILLLGQALAKIESTENRKNQDIELLRNLIAYLIDLSPDQARDFIHRPRFLIWLMRLSNIACQHNSELERCKQLEEHLTSLDALLFNHGEFNSPSVMTMNIPPGGWIAPIEGTWYFESKADHSLEFQIKRGVLANIELETSLIGENLICGVRTYVHSGRIEIFPASHVPQIRLVNADGIRSEVLTPSAIESELSKAFALIKRVWPEAIDEVEFLLRGIIAIQAPGGRWINASSGQAPLVAQLTFKESAASYLMAEAIIHELSHMKMDILLNLFPIIHDDGELKYTHPWRQDRRPITGVLFGAHAFLNVLSLYNRIRRSADRNEVVLEEHRRMVDDVGKSLATLETHAEFFSPGRQLFDIMLDTYREASQ